VQGLKQIKRFSNIINSFKLLFETNNTENQLNLIIFV